jgi:CRISPR system Cascade subunit CasE
MLVDGKTLHMVRCRFDLPAMLRRIGGDPHSTEHFDLGYLVHWQLASLFGDSAPSTFAIRGEEGRWIDVLAYAERDAEALRVASHVANPSAASACDWTCFEAKPMPATWRDGARLEFEVCVCPVVRRSKDGPRGRKGAEVDAFLAACDAAGSGPVNRMTVYRDWLARQFARDAAAVLERFEPNGFRRVRLHRRSQGDARRAHALERPELSATGTIVVGHPEAFERLVRRGLGRHRAFGFGMILLRPER